MAKAIKLKDLKKVLTLATSSTKKLVEAGVQGQDTFPTLLAEYKWSGTRDFNLALIIIALYAYCLKQVGALKDMAQGAINKSNNEEKGLKSVFGALRHGNGTKLAEYLENDFTDNIQALILGLSTRNTDKLKSVNNNETILYKIGDKDLTQYDADKMRNKIFGGGLFKQAKKITKWKTNEKDVDYCVSKLKDDIRKTTIYDQGETYVKKTQDKDAEILNLKQDNEKIKQKLKSSSNIIKDYYNQIDQHFTQYIKLTQQLEELKKELKNSNLTIEEQKKLIQKLKDEEEFAKAKIKLMLDDFIKETNEILQLHPNENLNNEKVKEVKEKTKKLQKIIDDFALKAAKPFILSNGETFVPNINKNRRKSMGDVPTITIDEIKKARKNLKSIESND